MTQQRLAKPPDDPADFQASLLRQQNDLLYKNLPSSILGTLIVAVSAAAFFWQTVQQQRLLIWLAAVIGVGLARTLILWSYRTQPASPSARQWHRLYMLGSWLSALAWGSAALLIFPDHSPIHQILLGFMLTGVAVVGLSSQIACFTSATGFLLITLTPMGLRFLSDWQQNFIPGLLLLLMIPVSYTHLRAHET